MALIAWRDEFKIGIPSVDHEHQELIELINQLFDKLAAKESKTSVSEFFGELHAKIAAHFALEERLMREQAYFEYEAHKADHEQLLDDIREIMDNYWLGAYLDYSDTLAEHLNDWFTVHFKTKDARLHAYLD
ncbi:MAG: bacteriohemerythrin [Alphaproteobacteria bacterium]|nr:bacteriohemerythrin [Alphaproteobacteria bacterium]